MAEEKKVETVKEKVEEKPVEETVSKANTVVEKFVLGK